MSMTAQEMVNAIKDGVKDPSGVNYGDGEVVRNLNWVIMAMVRRIAAKWPDFWLAHGSTVTTQENLVKDQSDYALPSRFYAMIDVYLSDDTDHYPRLDLRESKKSSQYKGWYLVGGKVRIVPTPDANETNGLTMFHISFPAPITTGDLTVAVTLSDEFPDMIHDATVIRLKARQGEDMTAHMYLKRELRQEFGMYVAETNQAQDAGPSLYTPPMI